MNWNVFKKSEGGKFKITGRDKSQLRLRPNLAWRAMLIIFLLLLLGGLAGLYYLFATLQNEERDNNVSATVASLQSINRNDIVKLSTYLDARAEAFTRYQTEKPLVSDPSVAPR